MKSNSNRSLTSSSQPLRYLCTKKNIKNFEFIIPCYNTPITMLIFYRNPRAHCHESPDIDLTHWKEEVTQCRVNGLDIVLGSSRKISPCTSCTCTKEGVSTCYSGVWVLQGTQLLYGSNCQVAALVLLNDTLSKMFLLWNMQQLSVGSFSFNILQQLLGYLYNGLI